MSRQLKTLILLSLLLNLLLLGYICGHTGRGFMTHRSHAGLHELVSSLPEERRQQASEILSRFEQDTGELHEQLSDARKKAATLLKAEPFDREAYMAQAQAMQQLHLQMTQRMAETVAGLAQQCTPEERVALADILRRRHRHGNK